MATGPGDLCDNCPAVSNAAQTDGDSDGTGTDCDNCPTTANSDQADPDLDGLGSLCENCPTVANPGQENSDSPPTQTAMSANRLFGACGFRTTG